MAMAWEERWDGLWKDPGGGGDTYIPHKETRMVAKRTERTKGASIIAPANIKCENIQAVRRSGL